MSAVGIAKFVMKRFQSFPVFNKEKVGEMNEVFHHSIFLNSTAEQQKEIMLKSSQSKYDSEIDFPFDNYFGFPLLPILRNKTALDLGSFTGGRTAAWFERYKLKRISGTDINQIYIDAATQFAKIRNINADYRKGRGESIPYENDQFDVILTFDVLEHVQNIRKTMDECYRVLKPGGKLIAVFPSYYQPLEHHLGRVTRLPGLQYVFSGKTQVKAYYEILKERGDAAYWYRRDTPFLEEWEKGNTINGTTFYKFRKLINDQNWKIWFQSRKTIGSTGRYVEKNKWIKIPSLLFIPFTYVPIIQDIVLHRIAVILEKEK